MNITVTHMLRNSDSHTTDLLITVTLGELPPVCELVTPTVKRVVQHKLSAMDGVRDDSINSEGAK